MKTIKIRCAECNTVVCTLTVPDAGSVAPRRTVFCDECAGRTREDHIDDADCIRVSAGEY